MNTPIKFECTACNFPLTSQQAQPDGMVICPKCGHENTPPKGYTPPDSVDIKVRNRYFSN